MTLERAVDKSLNYSKHFKVMGRGSNHPTIDKQWDQLRREDLALLPAWRKVWHYRRLKRGWYPVMIETVDGRWKLQRWERD